MDRDPCHILTINGGSSSIKFAVYEAGDPPRPLLSGSLDGIGQATAALRVKGGAAEDNFERPMAALDHRQAVGSLMDWFDARKQAAGLKGIGHRVVHGGTLYS